MGAVELARHDDRSSDQRRFEQIIGSSRAMESVLELVERVAPTDSTVLIQGETGTGKELIAGAIHMLSARYGRPLVKVNCAAIPLDLLESELFGHEKGAFTGAIAQRMGRFELADKGTLFLDEVADIPPVLQPKLLRVLQEQEFERLGSTRTRRVDVRIVAATNRDLTDMVTQAEFRPDLYYRLNIFPIVLPPLRERREDIPALVTHYVEMFSRRIGKRIDDVPGHTMSALVAYEWPGNIRELRNLIERAVVLSDDAQLSNPLLSLTLSGDAASVANSSVSASSPRTASELRTSSRLGGEPRGERDIIEAALADSRGRVSGPSGAAVKLGIPPTTLESRIKALKIRKKQFKFSWPGRPPEDE